MTIADPALANRATAAWRGAAPLGNALTMAVERCTVAAPARLHLGFLDPSATLGRRFGSLGLVIDGFEAVVELATAAVDSAQCDPCLDPANADAADASADLDRALQHVHRLRQATGLRRPLALTLRQRLPAHAGLGSGTQLALAVGAAFARLHALKVDTPTLAAWLGRGLRSGVGIAGFDHGGLLLDGGPGADGRPAPLLSRLAFPARWALLVVLDPRQRGLSGADEKAAIAGLPPLPAASAAELCHEVLMRVLPGAAEADFALFAAGLTRLQAVIGAHFAPAQHGLAYTSAAVGRLMAWLAQQHGAAVGQSSWGPTGFAVLPSAAQAAAALAAAQAAGQVDAALRWRIVGGRNRGAQYLSAAG